MKKRTTVDKTRDAWARAFIMTGTPYSLFDDKYFRFALKATINCHDVSKLPCRAKDLSNVNDGNVHDDVETRVDNHLSSELRKYGGCIMSDGAKGTASTPFSRWGSNRSLLLGGAGHDKMAKLVYFWTVTVSSIISRRLLKKSSCESLGFFRCTDVYIVYY